MYSVWAIVNGWSLSQGLVVKTAALNPCSSRVAELHRDQRGVKTKAFMQMRSHRAQTGTVEVKRNVWQIVSTQESRKRARSLHGSPEWASESMRAEHERILLFVALIWMNHLSQWNSMEQRIYNITQHKLWDMASLISSSVSALFSDFSLRPHSDPLRSFLHFSFFHTHSLSFSFHLCLCLFAD